MSETSQYARENYLPRDTRDRAGIALCLSGGGYRATLFHLGALRRLNELGILPRVTTISSVSGGSITAAHLATSISWPLKQPLTTDEWDHMTDGLREVTRHDIRTPALLNRFVPTKWLDESAGVRALMAQYEKHLTGKLLSELPASPNFVFCSTDLSFGANWVFEKGRTGSYQAGYKSPPPSEWKIARAVAASSCFPPIFNPLPIRLAADELKGGTYRGPERDKILADLRLSDGGVYDNLGLEPVWKDHEVVMVSDGGGTFDFEADKNLLWRLQRYITISGEQGLSLRKRWFISSCINGAMKGTYWGVGSARTSYEKGDPDGYSKELASTVIAKIRTDLDAFSDAEASVLENQGYLVADIAVQVHVPELVPSPAPPLAIPHPEWMDDGRVREALAESGKRRILGH